MKSRAMVATRAQEAVAEDHQELDLRQVLRRQGIDVHREVGDDAGGLEDRSQALLEVAGLVRLVADQDQRVGPGIRRGRLAAVERGDRDGQLAVDVLDVLGGRGVVGHPDEAVGGEPDLVAEVGERPALGDVVADLPAELGQEPALAGERPRGRPTSRTRGRRAPAPAPPAGAGSRPTAPCRCRPAAARGPCTTSGPAKSTPGPAGDTTAPAGPRPDRAAGSRPGPRQSPIGVRSARARSVEGSRPPGVREQLGLRARARSRRE